MNSNSILNSNLLDIIFDNRNKEYGAYVLRRDYNKRGFKSLLTTVALVATFVVLQMQKSKTENPQVIPLLINDPNLSKPPVFIPKAPVIAAATPHTKVSTVSNLPPIIVEDVKVLTQAPTNLQLLNSTPGDLKDGALNDDLPGPLLDKSSTGSSEVLPHNIKHKDEIEISPEIAPQYPGGINEFINFLKRNLKSPEDLEEEAAITVKVKFIVSLTGDLIGFTVVETGGKAFDNEVIRVLKGMPKWLPGKTNGENVSSYYTIPVKFTSQ